MTEPLQVGQFGIVDHEPVDRGPNAGVFRNRGPASEQAELFLVAEGTTPAGEDFAAHVVSSAGQRWADLDMSLTGALRRVVADASRNVHDWNRKSVAQHRVSLGMSCFARKGDYAVLAQAGPALALHLHGGQATVYTPGDDHAAPIGSADTADPQFTRIDLRPGDRILMLSTVALETTDEDLLRGILSLPGIQALQDLYRRVRHLRHITVMLVEAPEERAPAAYAEDTHGEDDAASDDDEPIIGGDSTHRVQVSQGLQPSLFTDPLDTGHGARINAARTKLTHISARPHIPRAHIAEKPVELAPLRRAAGDTPLRSLAAAGRERASASSFAAVSAAAVAESARGRPAWHNSEDADGGEPRPPAREVSASPSASFARSLVPERVHPRPDPGVSHAPLPNELVRRRKRKSGQPGAETTAPAEEPASYGATPLVRPRRSMGGRWRGNGVLSRRSAAVANAPSTRFVVGIGAVLLLGIMAFLALPGLLDSDTNDRVAALLDSAERQLAAARVQDDPAEQRSALTEARALLLEAEQVGGTSTTTQQLLNEVRAEIATLDAVTQPARVELIGSLESYGDSPVTPSDIVVGHGVAYLMDTTGAQVIAQPLDGGSPSTVYREDADAGHGRPAAIAYYRGLLEPDGGHLLVADRDGVLWAVTPETGEIHHVQANLPAGTQLTDITAHNGELYVLDASQGTVYRMTGIDGSFPYEPQIVQARPDLNSAVRILIDDELITSSTAGTLQRYSGELVLELSQAGIDRRLSQPATPWAFGEGFIAMSDSANDRIVVLRRDGTFVRQYRHESFGDMAALSMRDDAGFVFAGGKLLRVTWDE